VTLPAPPKPLPRPKLPEKVVEKAPPKPVRAAAAPRRAEPQTRRPSAEPTAAQRTASLPAAASAGSANTAASAASAAAWRGQLVAYLQGNLRYPPGSHGGGAASVSFSMSRAGRVLSASLARSAGSPELDAAALDLFRRGALPPPPADVPGATFTFTIPIRFSAR
jgi:protein TonB